MHADVQDRGALECIMTGIATALVKGTGQRKLTLSEKAFYANILTYGGPMVLKFVSANLLGASESTSRRFRKAHGHIDIGISEENITHVVGILDKYNLKVCFQHACPVYCLLPIVN
jgi:hypothetical protein